MNKENDIAPNEKLIILADGNTRQVGMLMDTIKRICPVYLDSSYCEEKSEYFYLAKNIRNFLEEKDKKILIIRYSGNKKIAKEIGDRISQIVIQISFDRESIFYTKKPIEITIDMIRAFIKEKN